MLAPMLALFPSQVANLTLGRLHKTFAKAPISSHELKTTKLSHSRKQHKVLIIKMKVAATGGAIVALAFLHDQLHANKTTCNKRCRNI